MLRPCFTTGAQGQNLEMPLQYDYDGLLLTSPSLSLAWSKHIPKAHIE
jgi:hypothetical protein